MCAINATCAAAASPVLAEGKSNAWSVVKTPATGAPRSIGQYTSGCLAGAAELPLDGAGYQVMHPGRVRYFGHPDLV
jgi:penicillin-insensitive murein endopeptidase